MQAIQGVCINIRTGCRRVVCWVSISREQVMNIQLLKFEVFQIVGREGWFKQGLAQLCSVSSFDWTENADCCCIIAAAYSHSLQVTWIWNIWNYHFVTISTRCPTPSTSLVVAKKGVYCSASSSFHNMPCQVCQRANAQKLGCSRFTRAKSLI